MDHPFFLFQATSICRRWWGFVRSVPYRTQQVRSDSPYDLAGRQRQLS